jgi:hypothetical protein
VFGYPTYAHVNEGKLDPKAKKCIFMRYEHGVKRYRLWCLSMKKLLISRDVIFHESALINPKTIQNNEQASLGVREQVEFEADDKRKLKKNASKQLSDSGTQDSSQISDSPVDHPYSIAKDRPMREIKPPNKYGYADFVAYALSVVDDIQGEKLKYISGGYH